VHPSELKLPLEGREDSVAIGMDRLRPRLLSERLEWPEKVDARVE
jgi:hypothetical protein